MANLVTTIRLLLLFVLVVMAYQAPPLWQLANVFLVALIFALDGLDGHIARKRGEASLFGAVFDIAADRVVENVLWLVLTHLGFVPVWVGIVFITRSFLVDSIRSHGASLGKTPFGMMHSRVGRFLVAGRGMRVAYALAKALAFGWIFLVQPWPALFPQFWATWASVVTTVTQALVLIAVALCIVRGVPVLAEFALTERKPSHSKPVSGAN